MESSDTALTEYNQLRASVGMAPAADDDYYEYVVCRHHEREDSRDDS